MRFWDSSAVVPTLVREEATEGVRALLADDPSIAVWLLTSVEVESAIWRQDRSGDLEESQRVDALEALGSLESSFTVIADAPRVAGRARRLLAVHPLRAADAMQLAAALVACDEDPAALPFVTLDDRLGAAARREGFRVLP